jgi:5'-deoxynucleotidase YfbR-like HD superfamily hydrolase
MNRYTRPLCPTASVTLWGDVIDVTLPAASAFRDLEHAAGILSRINRFNGHTLWPYSVAQHCIVASALCPDVDDLPRHMLFHDLGEIITGDLTSPWKAACPNELAPLERGWIAAADRAVGLEWTPYRAACRDYLDALLVSTELYATSAKTAEYCRKMTGLEPLAIDLMPCSAPYAAARWLDLAEPGKHKRRFSWPNDQLPGWRQARQLVAEHFAVLATEFGDQ